MFTTEYHGAYIIFVALFLAIVLGMQFGLLTLLVPIAPPFALAASWTLLEWARQYVLCGFPWNPVGLALTGTIWSLQCASLLGIYGLSLWVIWTNVRAVQAKRAYAHGLWLGMAFLPYLFGAFHVHFHKKQLEKSPKQNVALVQTGLLPEEKFLWPGRHESYLDVFVQWGRIINALKNSGMDRNNWKKDATQLKTDSSSSSRLSSQGMILFPETALPFSAETPLCSQQIARAFFSAHYGEEVLAHFPAIDEDEPITNLFFARVLASLYNADVFLGLIHEDPETHLFTNAAFLVGKEGILGRYDKNILFPIAEARPFPWLRWIARFYGIHFFFEKGTHFDPLETIATSICYEETFPAFMRKMAKKGARFFVNLTNDGFFPFSSLAEQHFTHGLVRSVENGIPLLRACNTGITAVVDSLGRIGARLGKKGTHVDRASGVLLTTIAEYRYATLYAFIGDIGIIILGCTGFLILFSSWILLHPRNFKNRPK